MNIFLTLSVGGVYQAFSGDLSNEIRSDYVGAHCKELIRINVSFDESFLFQLVSLGS